ncbi:MAG: rRNA maturation RNase YbeY [Actinomycetota bacterium]|nr:rRNA maturation RNase YbeY [Actinomycetota bacterium]
MNVDVSGASRSDIDEAELARFAATILERESVDVETVLSISFVERDVIAEFNTRHMGRREPTDVLSFPIEDASPNRPPVRMEGGPPLDLGDIVICPDVVETHADELGVPFESELNLMVVHGILHILGWDHQTDAEAEVMETREAEHLAVIGQVRR